MHHFLGSNNSGIAKRLNRMNNRLKCLHACQGYGSFPHLCETDIYT